MDITILGSGGWEGIPAPFCKCRVCKSAKDPKSKDYRTRPEILIETKKGKILLELSPDIRLQSNKYNLTEIKDFFISHWHFDHMYGLLELHAWSEFNMKGDINIYCSQKTKDWLDKAFAHIRKNIIVIKPFEKITLYGMEITPIPVRHMYSRDKDLSEEQLDNVFGFIIKENNKKFVYLPDYFAIPNKSLNMLKSTDIVVMDGTYLFEDLFPNKPEQNGLKSDPDHYHGKNILNLAKTIMSKKIVFHSITHLTEKKHAELQKMLPRQMHISYDGMKLKI
ncbi:MAG: MBL fold metallo-hydrolase [Candidatus Nanoarchaeia archaeon]